MERDTIAKSLAAEAETDKLHVRAIDRETVEIGRFGLRCRLRYSLLIAGEYLRATSAVVVDGVDGADGEGARITAHFITATITDAIRATDHGIEIARRWSVIPELAVALLFTVEVDGELLGTQELHYVAPGCCVGRITPRTRCGVTTDELASPVAALHGARYALAIASESGAERESLTIRGRSSAEPGARREGEGPGVARLDFRLPAALDSRRPDGETEADGVDWLAARAGRTVERRYQLLVARAGQLWHLLARRGYEQRSGTSVSRPRRGEFAARLEEALEGILTSHLVDDGPVYAVRARQPQHQRAQLDGVGDHPTTHEWLSASASAAAGAAMLLRGSREEREPARRLIDFALRGQHPSGMFYERYDQEKRRWRGLDRRSNPPRLALVDSLRVSRSLRAAAAALGDDPAARRLNLAWQRFASRFLQKGKPSRVGAVLTPGGTVIEDGMDALGLVEEWLALAAGGYRPAGVRSSDALPAAARSLAAVMGADTSVEGQLPSARRGEPSGGAALLVVEALLALNVGSGELWTDGPGRAAAANLLAWLGVDHHGVAGGGAMCDSVRRRRMLAMGNRVARALMGMASGVGDAAVAAAYRDAASDAVAFSLKFPVGVAFVARPSLQAGPIDSRAATDEIYYGQLLLREFPSLFAR